MKRAALLVTVVVMFAAILAAQEPASIRPEREAVDNLLQQWSEAINTGKAEALGPLVTDDVEFWGDGTYPLIGREKVVEIFSKTFSLFSLRQTIEEKERIWDESFVLIRGVESTKVSDKGVLRSTEMRRRIFMVIRREADGQWRIARGMSNTPDLVR